MESCTFELKNKEGSIGNQIAADTVNQTFGTVQEVHTTHVTVNTPLRPLKPQRATSGRETDAWLINREKEMEAFVAFAAKWAETRILVLCGPSGCGKTTFVDQMIHQNKLSQFSRIMWVVEFTQQAGELSEADLSLSFQRVVLRELRRQTGSQGDEPKNSQQANIMLQTEFEKLDNSLLVIDNLWNTNLLNSIKVTQDKCSILALSHVQDASFSNYPLPDFPPESWENILQKILKHHGNTLALLPRSIEQILVICHDVPKLVVMLTNKLAEFTNMDDLEECLTKAQGNSTSLFSPSSFLEACCVSLTETLKEVIRFCCVWKPNTILPLKMFQTVHSVDSHDLNSLVKCQLLQSLPATSHKGVEYYLMHDRVREIFLDVYGKDEKLLKKMHTHIVDRYKQKCSGDLALGPRDGYYFKHIEYHLKAIGCKDLFPPKVNNFNQMRLQRIVWKDLGFQKKDNLFCRFCFSYMLAGEILTGNWAKLEFHLFRYCDNCRFVNMLDQPYYLIMWIIEIFCHYSHPQPKALRYFQKNTVTYISNFLFTKMVRFAYSEQLVIEKAYNVCGIAPDPEQIKMILNSDLFQLRRFKPRKKSQDGDLTNWMAGWSEKKWNKWCEWVKKGCEESLHSMHS